MNLLPYLRGAAFYLFVYLFLGILNYGVFYLAHLLHLPFKFALLLDTLFSVLLLYSSFFYSVKLFVRDGLTFLSWKVALCWFLHLIAFSLLAFAVELFLSKFVPNPRLLRVLAVFVNYFFFFVFYIFLVSRFFGEEKVEVG